MTPRLMLLPLALALVATVTFASGESDQPAAAAEKEMVRDPSTGEMVTVPEYGGTIRAIVNLKLEGLDPYWAFNTGYFIGLVNEKLGIPDWAIDRSKVGYSTMYMPGEALTGQLAESWENPDPLTYVFKIRDGVVWHDKAPVNGRQLTAHDVAYSFDRLLGLSGGERRPHVNTTAIGRLSWESITATDEFTVEFKLQEPSLGALDAILKGPHMMVIAREVVEQFGDIQDWRNVTGTGPYQLTDVVQGSSWTYTKNGDYWGTDPKFPEYRLPYADTVEYVMVNDPAATRVRFKTIYEHYEFFDLGYYQIAMDYLRQIGIDVETQIVTRAEYIDKAVNHTSLGLRSDVWAMENGAVAPLDTYSFSISGSTRI